jgi:threonine/homoserine/homoserine lactone efflux protein
VKPSNTSQTYHAGMPSTGVLLAFAVASVVLVVIPGPNIVYILTRSVGQGRRAGVVSTLGIESGILVHIGAAAVGLSSLIATSAIAFSVVKYAGAAYLIYLGVRTLLGPSQLDPIGNAPSERLRRVYRDAVIISVLNPKVALFFLAFLPQFVGPTAPISELLVLGLVFFAIAFTLDLGYAFAGGAVSAWLRRRPARLKWQRYGAGSVYLGLGAYAALSGDGRVTAEAR